MAGNEQKKSTFWATIHEDFVSHMDSSSRNQSSLENRWATMQKYVNKFAGRVAAIEARNQSGKTEIDKLDDAVDLHTEQFREPFALYHVWAILREAPNWRSWNAEEKKEKERKDRASQTAVQVTDTARKKGKEVEKENEEAAECDGGGAASRPAGRKSEKRALANASTLESLAKSFQDAAIASAKLARIAKRKAEALELFSNDLTMPKDTKSMDAISRRFYETKETADS